MTPTDIKNIDLSKHTVLAVDDIPMNLLLISKILSRLNISISTAANGREALDFIAKQVKAGRQAYIVCPAVEQSEDSTMQSVEEYAEALRRTLDALVEAVRFANCTPQEDYIKSLCLGK